MTIAGVIVNGTLAVRVTSFDGERASPKSNVIDSTAGAIDGNGGDDAHSH